MTKSTAVGKVMVQAHSGKTAPHSVCVPERKPHNLSVASSRVLTLLINIIDVVEVVYVCQEHSCLNNCQKRKQHYACSICFHRVVFFFFF